MSLLSLLSFLEENSGSIWAIIGGVGVAGVATIIGILANLTDIFSKMAKIFKKDKKGDKKNKKGEQPTISAVQNNLPSSNVLIGRQNKAQQLLKAVANSVITVVVGQGGAGKSSLVLDVIKKNFLDEKHKEFDGVVWVSAKDEELSLETVIDTTARVMGYTGILQLSELSQKKAEIKVLLHKNNVLIVLDNYETVTDNRINAFIEDISDNCRVIVTSRRQHSWDTASTHIFLDSLSVEDGIALIKSEYERANREYTQQDEKLFQELCQATGGLPLAIKWAVGQVNARCLPLERVIEMIHSGEGDVFGKMFESGWQVLSQDSKQLLYCLSLFVTSATRSALKGALMVDDNRFDEALAQLITMCFVESSQGQLFSIHALTKSYVERNVSLTAEQTQQTYNNVFNYYLNFCQSHYHQNVASVDYDALEVELTNIIKFFNWANGESSLQQQVCLMADYLSVFLWSRGYWSHRIEVSLAASSAAQATGDYFEQIKHLYSVGIVRFWQGNIREARQVLEDCRSLSLQCNNPAAGALVMRLDALTTGRIADHPDAIAMFKQVLDELTRPNHISNDDVALFADWYVRGEQGYRAGEVAVMQEMGITLNHNGCHDQAIVWLEKSRALAQEIGDVEGQSVSLSHLGFSHLGKKDYNKAQEVCTQGLQFAIAVQRKSTTARCCQVLAQVMFVKRKFKEATKYALQAKELFDKLGMGAESVAVSQYIKEK